MTPTEEQAKGPSAPLGRRIHPLLFHPVDSAWLVAFRILYGLALAASMLRFLVYGWIDRFFVEPSFHFKYWGFEWVEPLSASGMHLLFAGLTGLALAVAAGALFRITAPLFALGLTYFQLIDVSTYLNHYYLAALLAWLLSVSPAHRTGSVDAWLKRRLASRAEPRAPSTLSAGWLYLFRFQVGVVYTFAGLAKAQSDWLLHGQPLRIWLGANTDLPVVGRWLTLEWVPLALSWCGFLFDTTIVAWLLYRKTRPWAYVVVIVFHALTRALFPIGMFPVIMVLSALVFFEPSWPRALVNRLRAWRLRPRPSAAPEALRHRPSEPLSMPSLSQRAGVTLALAYCAIQLALPLRSLVYGGNVLWHEQGMRFSWRVMVRAKGGTTTFVVRNKQTGRTWHVHPRSYINGLQESEMSSQPDLILQLAHYIHDDFVARGLGPVEVRADTRVSLNGRRGAQLIDPSVDLVAVRDGLHRARWILPAPGQSPPHTRPVL